MDKIAVIGAGPAGIAFALQMAKYDIYPILFEKERIGGLIENAWLVNNYPGFPDGIKGRDLASLFARQLKNKDIEVIHHEIKKAVYRDQKFIIRTGNEVHEADRLVCASGTRPIKLEEIEKPPNAEEFIRYEIKDMPANNNNTIAIIGAGDAAFDYAISLSGDNRIIILNRNDKARCNPELFKAYELNGKIEYLTNTRLAKIELVNGRLMLDLIGKTSTLSADFLLIAIGRKPELGYLSKSILDIKDELVLNRKLFFIGDVKNENMRQTAISTGDGVRAALELVESMNIFEKY